MLTNKGNDSYQNLKLTRNSRFTPDRFNINRVRDKVNFILVYLQLFKLYSPDLNCK